MSEDLLLPRQSIEGRVRLWHDDLGWGIIDCEGSTTGCWVHFSHTTMDGFRHLVPGQLVCLTFQALPPGVEPHDLYGCDCQAIKVRVDQDE